jgi:hypothetical protein
VTQKEQGTLVGSQELVWKCGLAAMMKDACFSASFETIHFHSILTGLAIQVS